jgi:hypothetical protein
LAQADHSGKQTGQIKTNTSQPLSLSSLSFISQIPICLPNASIGKSFTVSAQQDIKKMTTEPMVGDKGLQVEELVSSRCLFGFRNAFYRSHDASFLYFDAFST